MDLIKNITKHAPPKKLRVFREAMVNAEGLKIKKFNDKCQRNENTLQQVRLI